MWLHSFAVTDTQLHKDGYTIYKITSIVFPRKLPQALTCLTVWKRFHDVKKLHREVRSRHKKLQLTGRVPEPTDCSFFKRFDAEVIRRRKSYILDLLDFIALHPELYKCYVFFQFFSDPQLQKESPLHRLHRDVKEAGNAEEIYQLKSNELIIQPDKCSNILKGDKDDENGLSEITSDGENKEKLSQTDENEIATKPIECVENLNVEEQENQHENEEDSSAVSPCEEAEPIKPCRDYSRFLTPMASIESEDSDYIYEAALEFSHAVQAEANLEYSEAYKRYKRGVEFLLNGSKNDPNEDRLFIARTKITKYLARADDIEELLRSGCGPDGEFDANKTNFQLSIDCSDVDGVDNADDFNNLYLERQLNQLAKYKVLRILGNSVLQVQCITEAKHPIYVMKGIEKPSSNSPTQTIFLPQNVPYMVDLLAYFQSDQKIFLLLKHAEGGKLIDYIQQYTPTIEKSHGIEGIFPDVNTVDNESMISSTRSQSEAPTEDSEVSDLVRCSQALLQSVSNTLESLKTTEVNPKENISVESLPVKEIHHTRLPEASVKQWARELAVAIQALHSKGVILCDLHMDNLLLGAKGQLLLSYFYQNEGHNDITDHFIQKAYNLKALSDHYVAPERPLTFKSDWWSYGIVLYELLIGLSFKTMHPGRIDIYGCVQYPENLEISDTAKDLLENLLQQPPEERFDFSRLCQHEFFKGTNWNEVKQNGLNGMPKLSAESTV